MILNQVAQGGGVGGGSLDDYLSGEDIEIISNITVLKIKAITADNVTAIVLPECIELKAGAISDANYENSTGGMTKLARLELPKVKKISTSSLCAIYGTIDAIVLPSLETMGWKSENGRAFRLNRIKYYDFGNPSISSLDWGKGRHWYQCSDYPEAIIFRYSGVVTITSDSVFRKTNSEDLKLGDTCFVYVPNALITSYQNANYWSDIYARHPDMFKPIEGSIYETHYADGTPIS